MPQATDNAQSPDHWVPSLTIRTVRFSIVIDAIFIPLVLKEGKSMIENENGSGIVNIALLLIKTAEIEYLFLDNEF